MRVAVSLVLITLVFVACSPMLNLPAQSPASRSLRAIAQLTPTLTFRSRAFSLDDNSLHNLLFQKGDLPDDIRAGNLDKAIPEWMAVKLPKIDAAAGLSFQRAGMQFGYGRVQLLFDNDPSRVADLYQRLIGFEAYQRQGVPLPNIGDEALLFPSQQDEMPTLLFFHLCRTVADLRLPLSASEQPAVLNYATRLAQRLDAVDCHSAPVPILTPPPLPPTLTPSPPVAVAGIISALVTRLPDPAGENVIRGYAFADANHGWLALGAKIFSTDDGGTSWREQFVVDNRVNGIGFVSPQVGWIELLNGYLVTHDAGTSWQRTASKPNDGKMPSPAMNGLVLGEDRYYFCEAPALFAGPFAALDQQRAWAFCTSDAGTHYMLGVRLYQTNDGGSHWQLITDAPAYGSRGAESLFFVDQQHGWLGLTEYGISATDDGGRTWRRLPGLEDSDIRGIQFLTPGQGFVIAHNSSYNQSRDTLLRTDDGGATWRDIFSAPPLNPWPAGPTQFFADGTGIGAGDGYYSITVGGLDNAILSTNDAGRTWTTINSVKGTCPTDYSVSINALSFVDRQHGWLMLKCVADPRPPLYRTQDGGITWQALALPTAINGVSKGISFVDQQTGFIVAGDGRLWRTDNGGATFVLVDGVAVHTGSLRFVTREFGWEVRGVQLFETTDGGHTWKSIDLGHPVQAFSALPDGQVWAVVGDTASAGNPNPARRFLATRDAARTWIEYSFGDLPSNWRYPWLDGIQFSDAQHGWVKADTALFYTADGGQNWTQFH